MLRLGVLEVEEKNIGEGNHGDILVEEMDSKLPVSLPPQDTGQRKERFFLAVGEEARCRRPLRKGIPHSEGSQDDLGLSLACKDDSE